MSGRNFEAEALDFGDFCCGPYQFYFDVGGAPTSSAASRRRSHCRAEVPLRLDLQAASTDHLFERIGCVPRLTNVRSMVGLVIANAIHVWRREPSTAVFYSRDRNHYSRSNLPSRYVPGFYTYQSVMQAVAWLEQQELVEHLPTAPSSDARHRSRLLASKRLIAACSNIDVVSRPKELIILRDEEGRPMPYRDTARTEVMRRDVIEQNEAIQHLNLDISSACDERDGMGRLYRIEFGAHPLQGSLRRIFNRRWTAGGRWYGGAWQNLPKRVRQDLLIDGQPVIELDYRTCHPRLLCAMSGVDLPFDDPAFDYYDLPGFPRQHVKLAFNILINARSEHAAVLALDKALARLRERNGLDAARLLLNAIQSGLPGVRDVWRSGIGLNLQYRDAEICARVQRTLRYSDVTTLAIHDSFVVTARHANLLRQVMAREMEVECKKIRST